MKRTRATPLIALALVGLVLGFLLEVATATAGLPHIVPPVSLPITLVAVGIVVVALAWPIRQATRAKGTGRAVRPVNPFVAMRVAVLAKASSLSGALLLGAGSGIVLYILTRAVVPAVASLWLAIAVAFGAAIMLAAGLVAEHFCSLPPSDDDHNEHGAEHV
jgi:hypothetical protein